MAILVTGGAGYIGSHTCVELLERGEDVVVFDNLSNSRLEAVRRVEQITGKRIPVIVGDVRDAQALAEAFDAHPIEAVIHFAGLKAVGESTEQPLLYYENNVTGTLRLLTAMRDAGVRRLVFSSSATVYGDPVRLPLTEDHPLTATNPYGRTKLMAESMLRDLAQSEPDWRIAVLRYFNPVGAHESGLIGEDPLGTPNNLMPYLAQVAIGRRPLLRIFGGDYPTPDGTGVRDYVHVVDLAAGHVAALGRLREQPEFVTANLGTGSGRTVLEMVRSFEAAVRPPGGLPDRRPPARRRRGLLRRRLAGRPCAGVAFHPRPAGDVRRHLALAEPQPGRLPGVAPRRPRSLHAAGPGDDFASPDAAATDAPRHPQVADPPRPPPGGACAGCPASCLAPGLRPRPAGEIRADFASALDALPSVASGSEKPPKWNDACINIHDRCILLYDICIF